MEYEAENRAKADFSEAYVAPTPHDYVATMAKHGYEIGEQARPYCTAAAEMLQEANSNAWPVGMLDIGCSYGLGSAFVKFGCSFDEIVAFFASRAPTQREACVEVTRMWLNVAPPVCDIRCVGLDSSAPAVEFAVEAGLLDGGIARNLEAPGVRPTDEDVEWFRSCNLLISTGAIGYVTDRTLSAVLPHLGKDHPGELGPFAIMTILRMFDALPVAQACERFGLHFGQVGGVRLPQRRFTDEHERESVLDILHERGVDTHDWEDTGRQYADLFIAAPREQFSLLVERMVATRAQCMGASECTCYIRR
jgi:hypothetical protein